MLDKEKILKLLHENKFHYEDPNFHSFIIAAINSGDFDIDLPKDIEETNKEIKLIHEQLRFERKCAIDRDNTIKSILSDIQKLCSNINIQTKDIKKIKEELEKNIDKIKNFSNEVRLLEFRFDERMNYNTLEIKKLDERSLKNIEEITKLQIKYTNGYKYTLNENKENEIKKCVWKREYKDSNRIDHRSACGGILFSSMYEYVNEHFKFCPYCQKEIEEIVE